MSEHPWQTHDYFVSPGITRTKCRQANSTPPRSVAVHDVTLRDGEQQAGVVFTPDDKMRIAEALAEAGVDRIEAGLPAVSPADFDAVKRIAAAGLPSRIFAFSRCMVSDVELALEAGVDGIVMEVPSSRHIIELAYNWPYERAIEATVESTRFAHENGLEVRLLPDRLDARRHRRVPGPDPDDRARRAHGRARSRRHVRVLNPPAASYMTRKVKERITKPLETHFHMDFGLGVANTLAAVSQGVGTVQVSVTGVGERSGNVPLEDTVLALKMLYGVETGIDYSKLYGLSKLVRELAGVPVPPNRGIVGDRIFHVESGIITSWVKNVKQEHLTEAFPFRPGFVGQTGPEIVLGKGSGLDSIHIWLERIGLPPADEATAMAMLQEVKAASLAKKGLLDEEEFRGIAERVRDALPVEA